MIQQSETSLLLKKSPETITNGNNEAVKSYHYKKATILLNFSSFH